VHFAYLDASALVKRYTVEQGTVVVDHLFGRVPPERMIVLSVGMAEVVSILVRKRNGKRITAATFQQAFYNWRAEVGTSSRVQIIAVDGPMAERAYDFVDQYSINSTDAILLRSALDLAAPLRAGGDDVLVVASDLRLLRAARAEGLMTFNPETETAAALDALLGP